VSGSAYKIAKDRAYHHGTMLISSQLSTLGDVLHVSKVRFTYHYMLAYISDCRDGVIGIYDNPRRRVDPLASKEFARIQSSCESRQIRASYGPSFPRKVSRRRARTSMPQGHFIILQLIAAPLSGPGAIRASGGCDKHTIHSRQHGRISCKVPHIRIADLIDSYSFFQEWDWAFGQTPEFTYSISRSFGWGNVVSQPTRGMRMMA